MVHAASMRHAQGAVVCAFDGLSVSRCQVTMQLGEAQPATCGGRVAQPSMTRLKVQLFQTLPWHEGGCRKCSRG